MEIVGRKFLAQNNEEKTEDLSYVIGFHRSFATSIEHLHLHAFQGPFKTWYKGNVSYNPRFYFFIRNTDLIE